MRHSYKWMEEDVTEIGLTRYTLTFLCYGMAIGSVISAAICLLTD